MLAPALVLGLAACGGDDASDAPATTGGGTDTAAGGAAGGGGAGSETDAGPKPFDPSTAGTISGHVRANGLQPPRETIEVAGEAHCVDSHEGGGYLDDRILVDADRGLANAFVWIEDGLDGWEHPDPQGEVVLDQVGCLYTPRIFGMRTGQTFVVKNSDAAMHNVHFKPKNNSPKNWGMPEGTPPRTTKFKKPEVMIEVKCDVHPWMKGWIGVVEHPCFAVTAEDGSYTLPDVPPGAYTVGVWHESLGEKRFEIEVGTKQDAVAADVVMEL